MLKIFNTEIYGLKQSLVASGYPMREDLIGEWVDQLTDVVDEKEYKRGKSLGNVPTGTGHDNFLKGIIVQFDVRYPNYWTPQFQRYNFIDIVSSTSKMHRLTKMDIATSCNKYVDEKVIKNLNKWIKRYNDFDSIFESIEGKEKYHGNENNIIPKIMIKGEWFSKYELYMKVISNCPMGFEQTMRVSTSYLQLKTIYLQRKNHKLREDWGAFCQWCESLPHFEEFCIKEK